MSKKSTNKNYVAVESGGEEYPQLYCPACGKAVTRTDEPCSHLLFECAFSSLDRTVSFNYVHPKFNKTTDALEDEFYGTSPTDLASKLNLDPECTMVLSVTNMLVSGPACAEIFEVAVAIEFPPPSEELKAYKKAQAKSPDAQSQ